MKVTKFFVETLLILLTVSTIKAQEVVRCGTTQHFKNIIQKDPARAAVFEENNKRIAFATANNVNNIFSNNDTIYLPVVFHLLLTNQNSVTDQQIFDQIKKLNEDFAGKNGDSVRIPSYFKPVWGKSVIQFRLAQRTPDLNETNGIIRYQNALAQYNVNQTRIHYTAQGGANVWDPAQYINIWVGKLANNILGQATYPNMADPAEDGIIIDYGTLPNGYYIPFNEGKTLTHEMGHYLFLYHIWGDDDGACSGSDLIDDTPNQSDATSGCPSGIVTDACTPTGNGIMYQNYMDYSSDACLVMFTKMQIDRMMQALNLFRAGLISSLGDEPVLSGQNNVSVLSMESPSNRVCEPSNYYDITFKNQGAEKITQLVCSLAVNNQVNVITLNVDMNTYDTYVYRLNVNNLQAGNNQIAIQVLKVNNADDDDVSNNFMAVQTVYAVRKSLPFSEQFTTSGFPPSGWYIDNPDNSITWAPAGSLGTYIDNYNYGALGQIDRLVLPPVQLPAADSIFFSFDVAAAVYSNLSENLAIWDTLLVEISDGCSTIYETIYKKTKGDLITVNTPVTTQFVPQNGSQWRRDSIDISRFKNSVVTLSFTNKAGYENNIYINNVMFRAVELPAVLREKGYMIAPNPVTDYVNIRFLQMPAQLKRIAVYDVKGNRVAYENVNKGTYYRIDLSTQPRGIYFITIETDDRKHTEKIIKL